MPSPTVKTFLNASRGAIIAGFVTAIFMYFLFYRGWESIAAGLCIGYFIYLSITFYNHYISKKRLRSINLFAALIINSFAYVIINLFIVWFFIGIFYLHGRFGIFLEDTRLLFSHYILIGISFGLVLSLFFNFLAIVNPLVGGRTLGKLFIGKYRNPVEVDQTFMFLDLKSSTTIAEKIGHLKFLSLVNDFFYDLSEPVGVTKGEIYKYVGDEAIITWRTKDAILNANCIRCFQLIEKQIQSKASNYKNKYGVVPEFKAGIHCGITVTGELGYSRREIAFMGDVVNTTARIEEACKTFDRVLLISEDVVKQIIPSERVGFEKVGKVRLRGKDAEITLFTVDRKLI